MSGSYPNDIPYTLLICIFQATLRVIDSLATNLPPGQVFPPLSTLIQTYFASADPTSRRGAMLSLGIAVEGCSEFMTPHMDKVWPWIEQGLHDSDASVRKASCVAVSCLCEWLEEVCVDKHQMLVPVRLHFVRVVLACIHPRKPDYHGARPIPRNSAHSLCYAGCRP